MAPLEARWRLAAVAGAVAWLCAACAELPGRGYEPPTLESLGSQEIEVEEDAGVTGTEADAIAAYRRFLETAPRAAQRPEALRRIGDLEMDGADSRTAAAQEATGAPDYRAAIERYEDFLKTYPRDPSNDRVLYQLARAQEQSGALEAALKTLDRLVQEHPDTPYLDEAQFRRGELLFATSQYVKAEQAYARVLQGDRRSPFRERALYMQGWSLFKLGRLDDALHPFLGVLDLKMASLDDQDDGPLDSLPGLSRADRELVEDTFRVASLCLSNLQGYESVPAYIDSPVRRAYEFRVYQQLGELYIRQDRTKDAADTFGAFARLQPLHAQAPQLQARVIDIYQEAGFATLALQAKKDYVSRYGVDSEFRRANPAGWERAQPLVKTHLTELARHHHALAQKNKTTADYQEAVRWYRAYIASFPTDPETAQNNFLLAELLFEDSRFDEAAVEYEKAAYQYPRHAKSADAGYAALLAYAQQEKRAAAADAQAVRRAGVAAALRFAAAFPADARTPPVLTDAAEKLYALGDAAPAAAVARQVLALQPPATPAQRRVAWTVVAHSSFESGGFAQAEQAYRELLALTPDPDPRRAELTERLAASVYKQGEQARDAGALRDAVGHFTRIAELAPRSPVRVTAQYDAAAALIALKDWPAATSVLEDFRRRYPGHALQEDVSGKLAVAYLEQGRWAQAAGEFERLAATKKDPQIVRDALWQAAELYEKAADPAAATIAGDKAVARSAATRTYERYLKLFPQPLAPAMEARWRLARLAAQDGNAARELALMKELFQADQAGGAARTDRTRYLGATAALALAKPVYDGYRKVALVEPLQRQLKLKKAKMQDVLKAYSVAADYGVADVTTAATYHIASLYQDFGKALLDSQRPKKLSKAELEQYNVLLEEQAFPFEEKATELHELNVRRAAEGIYDKWVRDSFAALAVLRPVRYGKTERSEGVIDAIR
jgi:outer membrane protein assembly factor BamD (BamD/ComL family)